MSKLSGLTAISRGKLAKLVRGSKGFLTPSYVANELTINNKAASLMLAYYAKNGWLSRIKRGLYVPLTMETSNTNVTLDSPWVIATKCFEPCYIGGWTAVSYWGFTEQIYNDIMVYTAKPVRTTTKAIQGAKFCLRKIYLKNIFGTKIIWVNGIKVLISDPSRTIVDILDAPNVVGGTREVINALHEYLNSDHKNIDLLLEYCKKLGKGVVYKRLGFLLEYLQYDDQHLLKECAKHISKGKNKLDPELNSERLITKWQLWIPTNLEARNDFKE